MTAPSLLRGVDPGPYLHRVRILRPGGTTGGTTDPATGKFVPAAGSEPDVVIALPEEDEEPNADVQDGRKVIERNEDNTPRVTAQATIFLRDESRIGEIEEGMTGEVFGEEYGDAGLDFEVVGVQRIDGSVFVNWL